MVGFVQASVINLIIENNKLIENEACLQLVFDLLVWCTKAVQVVGCPPFGWGYSYFFYFFMVRVRVSVQEMLNLSHNTTYQIIHNIRCTIM